MAQTKADLARKYRDKYGMDMPTMKLARIMYKDNKLLFSDVDHARTTLRAIEGKGPVRSNVTHKHDERPKNPYSLPETFEESYEPFILDASRLLVLSDIHLPYHSIDALTAAFTWASDRKPDAILLNGDTIDFHGLSRFQKDPKKRSIPEELKSLEEFVASLRKTFPKARLYFKIGNHEERYRHFLWQKAYEIEGMDEFKLENIIRRRTGEVEIIDDRRIMKAGELNIIHGHEFGGSIWSPVNIARGLYLKGKVSAMQGHNHQTSEHTESDMNGKIVTTWSLGCLSELHPYYLRINKWNHGFAWVEIEKSGAFDVINKRIYKGEVL